MALFSRVLHHSGGTPNSAVSNNSNNAALLQGSADGKNQGGHRNEAFTLSIKLESPPVILYGRPHESTGSIISGLLLLDIDGTQRPGELLQSPSYDSLDNSKQSTNLKEIELESVTLSLVQTIKYTKPFLVPSNTIGSCKNCQSKENTLARWDVVTTRALFTSGRHAYPFSHLLPGSLPASSKFGSSHSNSYVKYAIIAEAKTPDSSITKVTLPLTIARSILRGPDRNSLRVFPPTEVTASAVLPSVIYPKSAFPIELKLNNVVNKKGDRRWRMRKLTWRIEENSKIRASTCSKHESKLKNIEDAQKRIALQRELKTGSSVPAKVANAHHSTIETNLIVTSYPGHQVNIPEEEQNDMQNDEGDESVTNNLNSPQDLAGDFFSSPSVNGSNAADSPRASTPLSVATSNSQSQNEAHLYLEETRTISHGELKAGWKSDFSGRGQIELVADMNTNNFSTGLNKHHVERSSNEAPIDENQFGLKNGANVACDVDDPNLGIFVSHLLIVEVVIAEELLHNIDRKSPKITDSGNPLTPIASASSTNSSNVTSTPQMGSPTGAARVLRMQFKLILTERSGLGIAWDDEVPPTYEDVRTLSPPAYHESSSSGTPASTPNFSGSTPVVPYRQTPGVIYGFGDTPLLGSFSAARLPGSGNPGGSLSIDHLVDLDIDDREQEFTL